MREARSVTRDIEVAAIPYGEKVELKSGQTVFITQSLGGSYTVMTDMGYMVRIEGKDADAIGETPVEPLSVADMAGRSVQEMAWEQLKTCFDPEIPVNMVDLGLVYTCESGRTEDDSGDKLTVRFTLTAPGCGMGDYLREDIRGKLLQIPGVKEVDAQVVFDPPWNQAMMSDAARLQLGLM
jgi:probable FeS assembly SUF system protein SufT